MASSTDAPRRFLQAAFGAAEAGHSGGVANSADCTPCVGRPHRRSCGGFLREKARYRAGTCLACL